VERELAPILIEEANAMATIPAGARGSLHEPGDDREQRLNEVIAGYLEDLEAGRLPDRPGLMARHPDLAAELASFFANREHLERLTAPLRDPRPDGDTPAVLAFPAGAARDGARPETEPRAPRTADSPGRLAERVGYFGDYELIEVIAEGGMGVVFKARQVSLDRVLALKMVRSGRFATAGDLERFRLEAEAAAHLDHPNIVPIYEVGEHEGHHYFSMKLVDGGSLAAHVGRYAEHPRDAAALVATVARAVHYAHQRGILHRDLKPANILIDGQGRPHVIDFGLAKRVEGTRSAGLTQSGSILGTTGYMAPEQAAGPREAITTAVDIHALGAILYELLTGRPPFRAGTILETLRLVREEEPARPRSINPRIDRDLETIVLKCLEKAPSRRYASAQALADDLDLWLSGRPIHARPASVPERLVKWARRRPAIAALLLIGMVAIASSVLAIGGLVAWNHESDRRHRAELRLVEKAREYERIKAEDYFARILAADQALSEHDPDRAGRLLEECPPELRGWEWQHLSRRLHPEWLVIQGHTAFICASDYAPGNGQVLCESDVLPGSVWDILRDSRHALRTGSPGSATDRIRGLDGTAYGLSFDRSGTRLATAGPDGVVKVWNMSTGKLNHLIVAHRGWAMGVAFSPDGARLATAGEDGMVRLWDVGPGSGDGARMLKESAGHDGRVFGVSFSPDGARVASAGADGTIRVWDPARAGSDAGIILRGHRREVLCVAFHPDGVRVASGGADRRVRIWDSTTGRELASFDAETEHRINALAYDPAGTRLAVGSHDRSVAIWDTTAPRRLIDYPGHSWPVLYVGFSPGGKVLASASQDATIKLWDPNSPPGMRQFRIWPARVPAGRAEASERPWPPESPRWFGGPAFAPSGNELAAAGTEQAVAAWNSHGGLMRLLRGGNGPMIAVAYSPDGLRLAAASTDRTARLWDLRIGRNPITLADWSEGFSSLAYRPDGKMLATGGGDPPEVIQVPPGKMSKPESDDRTVWLWDPASGRKIRALRGHVGSVHALAFNPKGTLLASAGADRTIRIWDPDSGRVLATFEGHSGAVFALAFSPDGSQLTSAGYDKVIRIWDVASGRMVRALPGHTNWVLGLAFCPDGERLASAGADRTVRLWDPTRGREVLTLRGPGDRVHGVAFSPDGDRLAAACADGIVRVWEAGPL
jgi:WD40 repeat protein